MRLGAYSTLAAMDRILDFAAGDQIDLHFMDANTNAFGTQGFAFIGAGAFSGTAGELRVADMGGGVWQAQGDVDGDGTADLVIAVTTDHALTAADFVL